MKRAVLITTPLIVAAASAAAPASPEPQAAGGTLDFQATLRLVSDPVPCPADAPPGTKECRARRGQGLVRGLGGVSETYTWPLGVGPPACPENLAKPLATTGRLIVAGKGEITFTIAEGARCVDLEPVRNDPQEFTSGRGKLERSVGGGVGSETWSGTLEVPGLEFDLTPPKLNGAGSKTVRARKGAKSARVTFKVTATDDVDGSVPVSCQPRSGSRFKLGRTTVRCEATDSSGNTGKAALTVIVRRSR
jgi:hypothetical protein